MTTVDKTVGSRALLQVTTLAWTTWRMVQFAIKLALLMTGVLALGIVAGMRLDAKEAPAAGASAYVEALRRFDGQAAWDARSTDTQDKSASALFYQDHS